ncbi:MAG TPA: HAMP domain-containing sensor histidine kinase [Dehalococcoidia bacterium]|nr:HAMP domain-containing sensor histidine kinase [Dehalococcoidia bacterium]
MNDVKQTRNSDGQGARARLHYAPRADAYVATPPTGQSAEAATVRPRPYITRAVRYPRPHAGAAARTTYRRSEQAAPAHADAADGGDTQLFIAMISHELRSPLTTIMGYAHLLRREGRQRLSDTQRDQAISDIDDEAGRLRILIDNLMTLAEPANADALRGQLEPTLVHRIAEQVILRHRKRHTDRRIRLHTPAWVPPARAVPGYVDQIVENFIANAEKYSRPRAAIDIEVQPEEAGVVVRVLDRGPGIEEAEARQLFAGFYRSAQVFERAPGNGIGLAVCKRLAEAQGGHVWARRREGGGSEFAAWLPAVSAPGQPA